MSRALSIKLPNTLTELAPLLDKLQRLLTCFVMNSAALAIGTAKAKILIANTINGYFEGLITKKTTAEITLTTAHNVANAKFNVIVLTIVAGGTVTARLGTEAATLGGVVFPTIPDGSAVIGYVIINPTGTGGFVGGTTELDDATVVPNAVYVNTPYPFIPGLFETL